MEMGQKIIPHNTYDDYVRWEGRWELIDGHPIAIQLKSMLSQTVPMP